MENVSLIIFYFKTLPQFKERQYMCLPGEKKRHLYKLDYLKLKIYKEKKTLSDTTDKNMVLINISYLFSVGIKVGCSE